MYVMTVCLCGQDDEKTSEYGSDYSNETTSGAFEEQLADAVIKQVSESGGMKIKYCAFASFAFLLKSRRRQL